MNILAPGLNIFFWIVELTELAHAPLDHFLNFMQKPITGPDRRRGAHLAHLVLGKLDDFEQEPRAIF